jgi:hypothetical protein
MDCGYGLAIAFLLADALALGVLEVALVTETSDHTLTGTSRAWVWLGTSRGAGGAAEGKVSIGAASLVFWESRNGDPEADGGKAEQQREGEARVHR